MSFIARLFLGNGKLPAQVRATLEAEGLVLVEEGITGSIRYHRFRAPGKRFDGKITGARFGIGLSEHRLVVYCRSGRTELIDSPLDSERWRFVAIENDGERLEFTVDYDRMGNEGVSGEIKLVARSSKAPEIAEQIRSRIDSARGPGPPGSDR